MTASNVLIYLLRRDLRVSDNPILHHLASSPNHGFTHFLPVYIFPAHQIEVSGFLKDGAKSPYPEARSQLGGFWRTGPHRAKIIGEAVWNLKTSLENLGSSLTIQAGSFSDVLQNILDQLQTKDLSVGAVWMTEDEGVEEKSDEKAVSSLCSKTGIEFRAWTDEKLFIDDRDLPRLGLATPAELPDVFTTFRKTMEPLREKPRATFPKPEKDSLPGPVTHIDIEKSPFQIPDTYERFEDAILSPVKNIVQNPPPFPENAVSAHPLHGGEDPGLERLDYLIKSGAMASYKDTRNGLIGPDFSTKLSAFLAQGCLTARQVHGALVAYEDGTDDSYKDTEGYGKGENAGTLAVRFELLWRDYMRLCTKKFGYKLFSLTGFRDTETTEWQTADDKTQDGHQDLPAKEVSKILHRIFEGTTGMGLIDASQRELIHTGYTSNRARQNVASFLAKHLHIDWRYGAEWYEQLLVDYDVSSNWANWQYVSGVGNDPRGNDRIFNPVKQAFDYDKDGSYVRMWVPELRSLEKLENVFQAWTTPKEDLERLGIAKLPMVEDPIKKIDFSVDGKPKNSRKSYNRRRGRDRKEQNGSAPQPDGEQQRTPDQQRRQYHNGGFPHNGYHNEPPNGYGGGYGYEGGYNPNPGFGGGGADFSQRNNYRGRGGGYRGGGRPYSGPRGGGGYRGRGGHYPNYNPGAGQIMQWQAGPPAH